MSHIVQLPVSDDMFERLAKYAEKQGTPVEAVITDLLHQGVEHLPEIDEDEREYVYDPTHDPLLGLIGAFASDPALPPLDPRDPDRYFGGGDAEEDKSIR